MAYASCKAPAWLRAARVVAGVVLLGLAAGCGTNSNGGGGGGGTNIIDTGFDFSAAGVEPGVNQRTSGRGRISGTVTNNAGAQVSGIDVTLYHLVSARAVKLGTQRLQMPATSTHGRQANVGNAVDQSDAAGGYVFGNVPPGTYRVSMQGQISDINVVANTDSHVNFTGAVGGGGGGGGTRGKWTIIVYLNAANDLEEFGPLNINQMEQYANSDDVRIVVLMKRIRGGDATNGDWTDARRFQIHHDDQPDLMTSSLLASEGGAAVSLGQIDMGNPQTMKDFIAWAQTNYPADHYLLDIWNHGSGWRPVGRAAGGGTRGISFDDESGNYIHAHEMDAAVTAATKLDIIMMDASLMQMAEVLYQIRTKADYIIGSEESPPGEGYPYQLLWQKLFTTPTRSAENVCKDTVEEFVTVSGATSSVTQSAFRTAGLTVLLNSINTYAQTLTTKDAVFHTQIGQARAAAQRYGHGTALYEGNKDLVDFIDQVSTRTGDTALTNAGNAVKTAMNNAMIAEGHTGSDLALSHGLAIFAPISSDWVSLRAAYRLQSFAVDGLWDEFWDTFYRING